MIEQHLKDLLASLIDDTIDTLDGPVRETAARLNQAAALGRNDIALECAKQLEVIVRIKKLRLQKRTSSSFPFILQTGVTMLLNGLIAGLAQARPR